MTKSDSEASAPSLDKDFEPDERLFHYTGSEGLYGIFQSECVWATHFRFLNDSKEFYSARESLTKFVEDEIRAEVRELNASGDVQILPDANMDVFPQEADRIVGIMYGATLGSHDGTLVGIGNPYVFSTFCCSPKDQRFADGGLLNWATYGRKGGYSIQINPHKLSALLRDEHARYSGMFSVSKKVVYARKEGVPEELREAYTVIGQVAREIVRAELFGKPIAEVDVARSMTPFIHAISCIKHNYFSDEREARLIIFRAPKKMKDMARHDVAIRHSGAVAIPYIRLFEGILFGPNCPVERIIIGPHSDNARRATALKVYVSSKNLDQIEISESNVPYVNVGEV